MRALLILLAACGGRSTEPLPESEPAHEPDGHWVLSDGGALHRDAAGLVGAGGAVDGLRVPDAIGAPAWSADGRAVVTAARLPVGTRLVRCDREEAWSCRDLVPGPGLPDRPALSDDGRRVAFVWAGPTGGWAGVWLIDAGASAAVKVTNTDVRMPKDGDAAPEGYTPLPDPGTLRFDGPTLRWTAQGAPVEVTP